MGRPFSFAFFLFTFALFAGFGVFVPVAQLDRAAASGAAGCVFEPRRGQFFNPRSKQRAGGSVTHRPLSFTPSGGGPQTPRLAFGNPNRLTVSRLGCRSLWDVEEPHLAQAGGGRGAPTLLDRQFDVLGRDAAEADRGVRLVAGLAGRPGESRHSA